MGIVDIMMSAWEDQLTVNDLPEETLASALLDVESYYASPSLVEQLSERAPELYAFFPGELSIDRNIEALLEHLKDHSYVTAFVEENDVTFDEDTYIANLEVTLAHMMYDLNMVTQLLYAYLQFTQSSNDLTQLEKVAGRHHVRKAFLFYIFGNMLKDSAGKFLKLNNADEYDDVVQFYDMVDDHIKPAIARFLAAVAPSVYTLKEDH